jgi:uncharacterized glyoxalase superfamily protein PhnB
MSKPVNVKQAVPFFMIRDMETSLNFYTKGLGFTMTLKWMPEGKLKWCRLEIDNAALMLQEYNNKTDIPGSNPGEGVEICFICEDALAIYKQIISNGISASEPFVGNNMWVVSLNDPDGYRISFESPTDVPEETKYSEWEQSKIK